VKRRSDLPLYLGLRAMTAAVRVMPRAAALAAGAALGRAALGLGLRRAVVDGNLARAFPQLAAAARAGIARDVYAHFGRASVDSLLMSARGPAALLPLVDGGDVVRLIDERLPRGRGVILLTGHVGNWELAGAYLAARGYPLAAVVKPPANPYVAAHAERTRVRLGIETILMHEAVARVPEVLRAGKLVALVADQGAIRSGVWAPFFGVPTQMPVGPGLFAARSGAPVLFGALLAAAGGRYQLLGEVLEDHPEGDAKPLAQRIAERFLARLEAVVRDAPAQYLWTHRLWKRQPAPSRHPATPGGGAPGGR
jgi:KDO2-lipid IV(A) lauroyltransferase